MAYYWLLKKSLNVKECHFIYDDDATLQNAIFRIFSNKFLEGYADYITLQISRNLSLTESGKEYFKNRKAIQAWGVLNGYNTFQTPFEELALGWLKTQLKNHDFYNLWKLMAESMLLAVKIQLSILCHSKIKETPNKLYFRFVIYE